MGTSTVECAGIGIEVFDSGEGAPLLWLHDEQGFSPDEPFASLLATTGRVVAPSHPGFGRSSLPDWLETPDDIAHVYLELLDRMSIDRFDLAGSSIGGWVAAEMVTKVPERVRRLVMIGPVGVKTGPPDRLDVPDIFALPADEVGRLMHHDPARAKFDPGACSDEELSIRLRNRETLALIAWEPWMHNPQLRRRLHRAGMPALFMRGASDGFVSAEYLARYAALLPDARIAVIPEAGHYPHLERPRDFVAAVAEFLET